MSGGVTFSPTFVFSYEKQMRAIQEYEYARSLLAENLWWARLAKTVTLEGASDRLTWFLNTATIRPAGAGGNVSFEPLVTQSTEIVPQVYDAGIKVQKSQLLDLRAGGLDSLKEWSMQMGTATAYFPQRLISELLMNGAAADGSANAYDGVPFFADNNTTTTIGGVAVKGHPYNPFRPSLGGYFNWFHGAPSGTYPGALPIDTTNAATDDIAFNNLSKAIAYVGSWKMPDGITPRFIRPRGLLVPSALLPRAVKITDAKYLAFGASSGGGSADVTGVTRRWGLTSAPIEAQELNASTNYPTQILQAMQTATGQASGIIKTYTPQITGSDTSYYLIMEENMSSQLGGLMHVMREPFQTNYFTGDGSTGPSTGLDAVLNRAREIEYICQGRLSGQYGHPYGVIRIDAT